MKWNARTFHRARLLDGFALGVTRIEKLAAVVVPDRLGDLVDEIRVDLLAGDPLRTHADGLGFADALVSGGGHRVGREEARGREQLVGFRADDRPQLDAATCRCEL